MLPHPKPGKPPVDVKAPLPPHMLDTCAWLGIEPNAIATDFPGDDA